MSKTYVVVIKNPEPSLMSPVSLQVDADDVTMHDDGSVIFTVIDGATYHLALWVSEPIWFGVKEDVFVG